MAFNETTALSLLMGRMDRPGVATPAPLTEYWTSALRAAAAELTNKGIHLEDTAEDSMLVANLAADSLISRDRTAGRPQWLSLAIRERWLRERGETDAQ
ncbi:MAG: hypothetical protein VB034_02485 [Eubacteriales bacterium]|nr:hypothetical protein [Eubacteriales bacterium]